MNHSSPTFADRLRSALGLGTEEITRPRVAGIGAPRVGAPRVGTVRQRGQAFADRLRHALDQR